MITKEQALEEIDRLLHNAELMEYKFAVVTTETLAKCKELLEEKDET